ncbi:dynein light chain LC8-type [Paragonimus westermani]|uniref:Dynein light chain n=2 Tax=Paragonimus westermani TaxID=34504 RepID=A0A5J4N565_9TREM|nr:dynein light chain LC8-type [Paragonimus westermani]
MDPKMQQHAVELCADAMRRYDLEKDIASYIKKDFERKYGPTWHCIVGKSYGRSWQMYYSGLGDPVARNLLTIKCGVLTDMNKMNCGSDIPVLRAS